MDVDATVREILRREVEALTRERDALRARLVALGETCIVLLGTADPKKLTEAFIAHATAKDKRVAELEGALRRCIHEGCYGEKDSVTIAARAALAKGES